MTKHIKGFFVLLFLLFGFDANSQDLLHSKTIEANPESIIDMETLKENTSYLASDECAGRETSTEGMQIARQYVSEKLMEYGLQPAFMSEADGYSQPLPLIEVQFAGADFNLDGKELSFLEQYYYFSNIPKKTVRADEFVFVGYGIDEKKFSDYSGKFFENKVAVISNGELPKKYLKTIPKSERELKGGFSYRLNYLRKLNPTAIWILDENFEKNAIRVSDYMAHKRIRLQEKSQQRGEEDDERAPAYFVKPSVITDLLGLDLNTQLNWKKRKNRVNVVARTFMARPEIIEREAECANVGGLIRGQGLSDEYVVLTAHLDHLGTGADGEIFNGADDNASGSAALLSIAKELGQQAMQGNYPERNVMFVWFSGEEKGLLGSRHFVNEPPVPINQIKANLNVDMIGRVDEPHAKEKIENYIYVIGSDRLSSSLHLTNEEAGEEVGINLDYTFNDENDPNQFYRRSDHYNFAKKGIPVIFYFSGVHEDYHKASDTLEKLNFTKMQRATELILRTTEKLIYHPEPIEVDRPKPE